MPRISPLRSRSPAGVRAPPRRPALISRLALGADLISFGRAFLANPDLVERLRTGLPLAPADPATYYQGGDTGCLTYSAYQYAA